VKEPTPLSSIFLKGGHRGKGPQTLTSAVSPKTTTTRSTSQQASPTPSKKESSTVIRGEVEKRGETEKPSDITKGIKHGVWGETQKAQRPGASTRNLRPGGENKGAATARGSWGGWNRTSGVKMDAIYKGEWGPQRDQVVGVVGKKPSDTRNRVLITFQKKKLSNT